MKTIVADVRVLRKLTKFLSCGISTGLFVFNHGRLGREIYEGADVGRNHRIHGINLDVSK